jgi:hypothetical protein
MSKLYPLESLHVHEDIHDRTYVMNDELCVDSLRYVTITRRAKTKGGVTDVHVTYIMRSMTPYMSRPLLVLSRTKIAVRQEMIKVNANNSRLYRLVPVIIASAPMVY